MVRGGLFAGVSNKGFRTFVPMSDSTENSALAALFHDKCCVCMSPLGFHSFYFFDSTIIGKKLVSGVGAG